MHRFKRRIAFETFAKTISQKIDVIIIHDKFYFLVSLLFFLNTF